MTPADLFSGKSKPMNYGEFIAKTIVALYVLAGLGIVLGVYELIRLAAWVYRHFSK